MSAVLDIFRVIKEEKIAFRGFIGVNLGFGGMAIWLPFAVAALHPTASPCHELIVALEQGNGYLFGLALLAAASSYWFREYINNKETEFKTLKISAALAALALMLLMAIALTIVIYGNFQSLVVPSGTPKNVLWGPLITQVVLTLLASIMAAYLFCLERLDDNADFGKDLKDKTTKKMKKEMDAESKTGFTT